MSEFHDVRENFTSELVVFGLQGAERLVNDYAIEAEAAEELARSANDLNDKDIAEITQVVDLAQLMEIVSFVDELAADSVLARRRHTYVTELLERAKNESD